MLIGSLKKKRIYIFIIVCFFGVFLTILLMRTEFWNKIIADRQKPLCKDCNVLIVSLDTCAARNISCYGYDRETSPNLCQIAKQSAFFQNAYSNASWTLPGHASIFTGVYESKHKMNTYNDYLSSDIPFLPEILQQHGYETPFYMPNQDPSLPIEKLFNRGISYIDAAAYDRDDYIDKALNTLIQNNNVGKKTFMFFHTYRCHSPYFIEDEPKQFTTDNIPEIPIHWSDIAYGFNEGFYQYLLTRIPVGIGKNEFRDKTEKVKRIYNKILDAGYDHAKDALFSVVKEEKEGLPYDLFYDYYHHFFFQSIMDPHNSRQMDYLRALYDQRIYNIDQKYVSKIQQTVLNSPLKDNTILIITADHGEEFGEHGQIEHATMYDLVLKVPLIVYIPKVKSTTITDNVQGADLMPTILDLVGIPNRYSFDGKSLVPYFSGKTIPKRWILAEHINEFEDKKAIRDGDWKVIALLLDNKLVPSELYNTNTDPLEQYNLLSSNFGLAQKMVDSYTRSVSPK
jgi:membrane-anchored protein YejM (alkaline phosphatase superfamily)